MVDADVEPVVAESVEMFRSPCELLNGSYTGVRLKRITREAELGIYLFCVQFLDVSHPKLYFQPHSRLFFSPDLSAQSQGNVGILSECCVCVCARAVERDPEIWSPQTAVVR